MSERWHFSLEDDGLTGQWVDLVDVATKSPRQFKALRSIPTDAVTLAALSEDEAKAAGRQFIALCVKAWLVNDPETGEPLPPPDSPSLDPDAIPAIVTARITTEVRKRMEEIQSLAARSRSA